MYSDVIVRLAAAALLGGLIGYERQSKSKAAGLRTHILVSLGACLYMMVSLAIAVDLRTAYGINADGGRIAAQVVSGIGFLGAGTILAGKGGHKILGLTTAASVWAVAAVGLAAGGGFLFMAFAATICILLTLTVVQRLDDRLKEKIAAGEEPQTSRYRVELEVKEGIFSWESLRLYLKENDWSIEHFSRCRQEEGIVRFRLVVEENAILEKEELMQTIMEMEGVESATLIPEK